MTEGYQGIERTDELKKYEEWLKDLASSESSTIVFNDGEEYAAILFRVLFENAKETVDIYCCNMSPCVTNTDDYSKALVECLDRNVSVRILLNSQEEDALKQPLLTKIGCNSVKVIPSENSNIMQEKLNGMAVHFTVIDGKMYRMEYDTEKYKAIASFNDKGISGTLTSAFNDVWNEV